MRRRVLYLPGDHAPKVGEVFKNPDLAASLGQIAEHGRDAFYKGEISKKILDAMKSHNGTMTEQDLAQYSSEWVEPISTTYRDWTVYEMPPNGQGIGVLEMLNIMETFPLGQKDMDMGFGSTKALHAMIETKKLAYADVAKYLADPRGQKIPTTTLLSKAWAVERAKLIDPDKAACDVSAGEIAGGSDTTYLSVVDRDGNMVSLIQSNYSAFGSGIVVFAAQALSGGLHAAALRVDWTAPYDAAGSPATEGVWTAGSSVIRVRADQVVSYQAATGRQQWTLAVPRGDVACAVSAGTSSATVGFIGYGTAGGACDQLLAVDLGTGQQLWSNGCSATSGRRPARLRRFDTLTNWSGRLPWAGAQEKTAPTPAPVDGRPGPSGAPATPSPPCTTATTPCSGRARSSRTSGRGCRTSPCPSSCSTSSTPVRCGSAWRRPASSCPASCRAPRRRHGRPLPPAHGDPGLPGGDGGHRHSACGRRGRAGCAARSSTSPRWAPSVSPTASTARRGSPM